MPQGNFSLLIDDYQQPAWKDTENKNEKCSEDGCPFSDHSLVKKINSLLHYHANHHATMMYFLILRGLHERTVFWSTIVVRKVMNFTQSFVVLFEHCERCLIYIFVQNSVHFCTLQVIASTGLLSWICHFFLYFLSIVVAFCVTVSFHQAFAFFWVQSDRM